MKTCSLGQSQLQLVVDGPWTVDRSRADVDPVATLAQDEIRVMCSELEDEACARQ